MFPLAKSSHILAPGEVVAAAARAECAIRLVLKEKKGSAARAHKIGFVCAYINRWIDGYETNGTMAAAYFKGREGAYIDRPGDSRTTRLSGTLVKLRCSLVEVRSRVARCGMKRGVKKRK